VNKIIKKSKLKYMQSSFNIKVTFPESTMFSNKILTAEIPPQMLNTSAVM
jgi:hypothetical protein